MILIIIYIYIFYIYIYIFFLIHIYIYVYVYIVFPIGHSLKKLSLDVLQCVRLKAGRRESAKRASPRRCGACMYS